MSDDNCNLQMFDCFVALGWVGIVGYGWPRGLWPSEASVLSRHGCHPDVLFHRQSRQSGEHPREMDARGSSLLSQRADHSRRQQEGPSDGWDNQAWVNETEARARPAGRRQGHGWQNRCLCLPGVLCQVKRGRPTGVWNGNKGSSAVEKEKKGCLQSDLILMDIIIKTYDDSKDCQYWLLKLASFLNKTTVVRLPFAVKKCFV